MKTLLFLIIIIANGVNACAAIETNGFLVFEVERFAYTQSNHGGSETKQKFKVPVTDEFLSNFKYAPSQNSSGTGFVCGSSHFGNNTNDGIYSFVWWLNKTADHRWHVHMWGDGYEKIKGVTLAAGSPGVTQSVTFKHLEDLDMSYQQSFVNFYDGVNVQFSVKFVPAKDMKADEIIPVATVLKTDRTILYKGDDIENKPIKLECLFQ